MAYVIKTNGSTKINPKTLNIDGSEDPFYRYKMRQLYVQVVGKGKMIKTVLLNVDDVAKDLKVHPKYLTAFLGYELGAQSKYDGNKPDREKASVSGERDVDTLTTILKKFIADLVLCEKCKLPETYMKVDKTGEISFTCRSCGNISTNVAMKPKFKQFVLNHPAATEKQPKSAGKGKKAAGKGKENGQDEEGTKRSNKKGSDDESEEDDGEEWSVDISEEAARQRLAGLLPDKLGKVLNSDAAPKETKEKDEYSSVFRAFVKETKRTEAELVDELLRLQKQHNFSNAIRVRLFCQANFQPGVAPSATKLKPHLQKLMTDVDSQKSLLSCLELLMSEDLLDKVLPVLKGFYDEDLLEEDVILGWHAEKPEDEAGAAMRTKVQPFITWLKEAEEESDEEDA